MANEFSFKDNKDIARLEDMFNQFFNNKLNRMFPIGALVLTMNNKRPNEIGYPGSWQLYSQGRTLVGRATSGDWDVPVETTGGAEGAKHTHTIYASEIQSEYIPSGLAEDRQIYSDVLDGDSDQCDPEHSEGLCYKYLLHSDDDLSGAGQNGKLTLMKTYDLYAWNQELHPGRQPQIGYANPIKAGYAGNGKELTADMPPYMVTNIWKRVS